MCTVCVCVCVFCPLCVLLFCFLVCIFSCVCVGIHNLGLHQTFIEADLIKHEWKKLPPRGILGKNITTLGLPLLVCIVTHAVDVCKCVCDIYIYNIYFVYTSRIIV